MKIGEEKGMSAGKSFWIANTKFKVPPPRQYGKNQHPFRVINKPTAQKFHHKRWKYLWL